MSFARNSDCASTDSFVVGLSRLSLHSSHSFQIRVSMELFLPLLSACFMFLLACLFVCVFVCVFVYCSKTVVYIERFHVTSCRPYWCT